MNVDRKFVRLDKKIYEVVIYPIDNFFLFKNKPRLSIYRLDNGRVLIYEYNSKNYDALKSTYDDNKAIKNIILSTYPKLSSEKSLIDLDNI